MLCVFGYKHKSELCFPLSDVAAPPTPCPRTPGPTRASGRPSSSARWACPGSPTTDPPTPQSSTTSGGGIVALPTGFGGPGSLTRTTRAGFTVTSWTTWGEYNWFKGLIEGCSKVIFNYRTRGRLSADGEVLVIENVSEMGVLIFSFVINYLSVRQRVELVKSCRRLPYTCDAASIFFFDRSDLRTRARTSARSRTVRGATARGATIAGRCTSTRDTRTTTTARLFQFCINTYEPLWASFFFQ